jgi:hypothetical protein
MALLRTDAAASIFFLSDARQAPLATHAGHLQRQTPKDVAELEHELKHNDDIRLDSATELLGDTRRAPP